jgi:dipeptidyl-peptidase-4
MPSAPRARSAFPRISAACIAAALCACASQRPAPPAAAARGSLDLAQVFELQPKLRLPPGAHLGWTTDGAHRLCIGRLDPKGQPQLLLEAVASGERRALYEPARMQAAFAAIPGLPAEDALAWSQRTAHELAPGQDALLLNERGDLYAWSFAAQSALRLTDDPEVEEVGELHSPDGAQIAFVKNHNLWVVSAQGGPARALTEAGHADLLHGRLDWVYQEEIYGRGEFGAFWWSPDSQQIAFLILDESEVPSYTIVDERERRPRVETWRYPKVGDPNPKVQLACVAAAGGATRVFDLSAHAPADLLIVRVGWAPDSREIVFQVQDRAQTWLKLLAADPASGAVREILRDSTPAWSEPLDHPFWLAQGASFVWRSQRDGYSHLYHYQRDGQLVRRLTQGAFDVESVEGIDEANGHAYLVTDRADSRGRVLERLSLADGALERLSSPSGTHLISCAPDARHYVDTWSSFDELGRIELRRADGSLLRELAAVDPAPAQAAGLVRPIALQVPARDGFPLEAYLLRPPDFDPSQRYPVLCHVYSGPNAAQVRDVAPNFNQVFHQMLAQQGYLVWVLDNRSASGKGLASAAGVYKNFCEQELADIEDGLDWLVSQGYADPARIGIWGWSFGGTMSAYALTHSKRFKLGIAGAPVTDWRLYDSIYTERYMGLLAENEKGYEASSVIAAAAKLSGRLLLIHGTIDENVHAQNSLQLAQALQQAGRQFDLMLYPGNRHGVTHPQQRRHLYALIANYVREHL